MSNELLIYALIDPRTGLVRYVGSSRCGLARPKQHRWPSTRTRKTHTGAWLRSLHREGLSFEIAVLDVASDTDALYTLERWWIAYGRASGWDLTNHTIGGEGLVGWVPTQETRAKISRAHLGRKLSSETRSKMSSAHKGIVFSPEHRERLSQAASRRWARERSFTPQG